MKLVKNVLFTLVVLSLLPISVMGQNDQSYEAQQIQILDFRIQNLISQRKMNRAEQDKINEFCVQAATWIDSYTKIQAKIQQAKGKSGDDYSFSREQLEEELQQLEQQRNAIYSLNGGTTIQGTLYNSIDQLQNTFAKKGKEIITLVNEDESISIAIRAADIKRDKFMSQLEKGNVIHSKQGSETWRQSLEYKVELLQETINRDRDFINDPNFICGVTKANVPLKCIHKDLFIPAFTEAYIKKSYDSDKAYDKNELIKLVKTAKENSMMVKELRKRALEEKINQIVEIHSQSSKESVSLDPSGCWTIPLGNNRSEIDIQENIFGEFIGKITKRGSLHKNYEEKNLFTITRINTTTFEGTEYTYSRKGEIVKRIPLRIIIQINRSGIDYRTADDILTLRPCP